MNRGIFVFLCLFLIPFFVVGGSFFVKGLQRVARGDPAEGWPMAGFALLFLGFSSTFLFFFVHIFRRSRRDAETRADKADTPWLWRSDWAKGEARSSRKVSVVVIWFFALFWNGISAPILFAFRREWENGNKAILIGLLFPLVGIGLLIVAIRMTLQWKRFGNSRLHLETLPGIIGHHFQARLLIPSTIVHIQKIDLQLACIRRTTTGSGKNQRTQETVLWEEKRMAPHKAITVGNDGVSLPVFFPLPSGQPETLGGNPAILWRLEARADLPGVDFGEVFEVPIFHSRGQEPVSKPVDPLAEFQPALDVGTAPMIKGVSIRENPLGVTIEFRPARNHRAAFSLGVFTAIWTGILVFMVDAGVPLLFALIWGGFDILMLIGVVTFLFHGVTVDIVDRLLTIQHRLIVPAVTRTLAPGAVRSVNAVPGMKSGNTQFYRIVVEDQSGRKFGAGGQIREKRDATWLAERIAIGVGL